METNQSGDAPVKVLQLTDTHLFGTPEGRLVGVDTYASLSQVIELSCRERGRPDLVLATGDLSQDESPASYERLRELLSAIGSPVYFLPGNHDVPALMDEILPRLPRLNKDKSVVAGRWQIILLSSWVEGKVEGHLAPAELERLDWCLKSRPDLFALVCLHHNPVSISCQWMDKIGLKNPDEFFAVIDRHRQVRGILWGHIHQEYQSSRGDLMLMATPSTCIQFKPNDNEFGIDERAAGYRWLELFWDGQVSTAVGRLPHLPVGLELAAEGY